MLKLLFWVAVIYLVYRYFSVRASLKAGKKRDPLHHQPPPPNSSNGKKEGEYIDYEEIK
jgi:hypothetical protein